MKFTRCFATMFAAIVFFGIARSQDSPPPPAPLVFSTPASSELQRFSSGRDGFEAVFPGNPLKTTKLSNGVFTETFTAKNKAQITIVSIYRLTETGRVFQDPKRYFETIKDELLKPPTSRLVSEESINVSRFEAKDFSVVYQNGFTKTRIVFTKERIFEITQNVTNWSAHGDAKRKAFDNETQRFYDSFKINEQFDLALIAGGITAESAVRRRSFDSMASEIGDADDEGWREYRFNFSGAAVSFPDLPVRETKPFESDLINSTLTSYTSVRDSKKFLFADVNLGIQNTGLEFRNGLYDGWQSGLGKIFIGSKIKHSDVQFNGMPARKVVGESDAVRFEAISLFSGGRLYQLMAITDMKGEDDGNMSESAASNSKFFDSFKTFPATVSEEENSASAQNTVSSANQRFVNDEFRFSIDLPMGWTIVDTVDLRETVERIQEIDPSMNRTGKAILTQSAERTRMLFRLLKPRSEISESASFICVAETIPTIDFDMKAIAEVSEENFISNMGYKLHSPMKVVNINGTIFYRIWLRKYINNIELKQVLYMTKTSGKIIQLGISYVDEKDLETMDTSLNTLKFEQVKK